MHEVVIESKRTHRAFFICFDSWYLFFSVDRRTELKVALLPPSLLKKHLVDNKQRNVCGEHPVPRKLQ